MAGGMAWPGQACYCLIASYRMLSYVSLTCAISISENQPKAYISSSASFLLGNSIFIVAAPLTG